MKIVVLANNFQWEELEPVQKNAQWLRVYNEYDFFNFDQADIYMNLMEDAFTKDYSRIKKPVLVNSVCVTLKEMNANENVLRINGWITFLSRANWEIAGIINEAIKVLFITVNKTFTLVPDEPGMIAARIISMIINEAYFALEEKLSTRTEMDIAMKLGTNYPYGPFEWCDKIGIKNVFALLQKLSVNDKRYLPSPFLIKYSTT